MTRETVIERARKLLSLSTSANIHEAASAAEKAHRLLLEHKLALSDVTADVTGPDLSDISTQTLYGDRFLDVWRWSLLTSCAWTTFCQNLRIEETTSFGTLRISAVIIGKKDDVSAVMYLFQYFEREIERLCIESDINILDDSTWKKGAAVAIQARLLDNRRQFAQESKKALILSSTSDAAVVSYVKKNYPETYKPRMHASSIEDAAYQSGYLAGAEISVPGNSSQKKLALPVPEHDDDGDYEGKRGNG